MNAPTQTLSPLPPLKSEEYDSQTASDQIQNASEKNPRREWDPNSFLKAAKNYAQNLWAVLIRL